MYLCVLQLRTKGEEENLAEWLVEITATPDVDVANGFASTYDRCVVHSCMTQIPVSVPQYFFCAKSVVEDTRPLLSCGTVQNIRV